MKRYILLVLVALCTLAFSSQASAGLLSQRYALDPVSDTCFGVSINPESPCYSGKGYPGCDKNYTDYTGCQKYCNCGYKYNHEKCDGKLACEQLAKKELEACNTQCLIDFS